MWIGSIKLTVSTSNREDAGTDDWVQAVVLRDGAEIVRLSLDYLDEDDLERGSTREYFYPGPSIPRRNDKTRELGPDVGQSPMPYPEFGLEFSSGLKGHLQIRLEINNTDMWIKDEVELHVKNISQRATSFDTVDWKEDSDWTFVAVWDKEKAMSLDSSEGVSRLRLVH
jgi:hypothetical protein